MIEAIDPDDVAVLAQYARGGVTLAQLGEGRGVTHSGMRNRLMRAAAALKRYNPRVHYCNLDANEISVAMENYKAAVLAAFAAEAAKDMDFVI